MTFGCNITCNGGWGKHQKGLEENGVIKDDEVDELKKKKLLRFHDFGE